MTDQHTLPESSSDKPPTSASSALPPEYRSGSQATIQSNVDLTRLEIQGAMRVLRFLQRDRQEVEQGLADANFDRQKGIFSGMLKAYSIAIRSIITNHPEIL